MQHPLFDTGSDWLPPNLADLPNWDGAKRIGIDIETCDPKLKLLGPGVRRDGFIVGVSFAIEDGPAFYLPMLHGGGDNLDASNVLQYLRDQSGFRCTLVGANLNYDLDYLAEAGVTFPHLAWQRDVMIADPLIYELHDSYSLDAIGKRWGYLGKDTTLLNEACRNYGLKDPRADLWRLPARFVGPYAQEDAALPLKILRKQERVIQDDGLWQAYDLESQVQPVLLKMTRRGVRVDLAALDQVEAWSLAQEQAQLDALASHGVRLGVGDVWDKGALAPILRDIGAVIQLTPKGQPKIDKEMLDELDHPVANLIKRARKVSMLRRTFAHGVRNHLVGDRIHCSFNQMRGESDSGEARGARFGRLSSEHPNLQNQPSLDDFASMWRAIYVPDHEGQVWFSADFSQQEPRILTHFAELMVGKNGGKLAGAEAAGNRYRADPKTDTHQMMADLCSIGRGPAKGIYLGICYGMGGAKLARRLGLPVIRKEMPDGKMVEMAGPEAAALQARFDQYAPFVRLLAKKVSATAMWRGYIKTLSGRRCHFPEGADGKRQWAHKAINRLIQGSAGDQIKTAMVQVDAAGLPQQLQVHDELDGSAAVEQAREIAAIMVECVQLSVPSLVKVKVGPSWGGAKEIK